MRPKYRRAFALRGVTFVALSALAAGTFLSASDVAGTSTPKAIAAASTVSVSPVAHQTIEGFGASGDWWTTDLQYFPKAARKQVAKLLFTKAGIDLSQYRYNIGGGGVGADKPTGDESELGFQTRAPASTYVAPGIYNWSHNRGGTIFLRYAAKYHVHTIEANVNSAPWAFTSNGQSCGGQLLTKDIPAYVSYLVHVVQHARNVWHATISYVSPMNEPDYNRSDCTQEGMQVTPSQRAVLVKALGKALAKQAPYAKVIADESSQVGTQFIPELKQWMSVPGTPKYVAALATHTYDFPSKATLEQASTLASSYGKQLWMTEICCVAGSENAPTFGAGYNPKMPGALRMDYLIWKDLTYGHMSAWDWWVSVSAALGCDPATMKSCATTPNTTGYNDGLLYYDPNFAANHDYTIYQTKRFWSMGNFSRFVRPGSVMHQVSGAPTGVYLLAFATKSGWSVVAMNENTSGSTPISLQLPSARKLKAAGAYQTSATLNLSKVGGARQTRSGAFDASLPAQSITTFLFRTR